MLLSVILRISFLKLFHMHELIFLFLFEIRFFSFANGSSLLYDLPTGLIFVFEAEINLLELHFPCDCRACSRCGGCGTSLSGARTTSNALGPSQSLWHSKLPLRSGFEIIEEASVGPLVLE